MRRRGGVRSIASSAAARAHFLENVVRAECPPPGRHPSREYRWGRVPPSTFTLQRPLRCQFTVTGFRASRPGEVRTHVRKATHPRKALLRRSTLLAPWPPCATMGSNERRLGAADLPALRGRRCRRRKVLRELRPGTRRTVHDRR